MAILAKTNQRKSVGDGKGDRFLITVTVLGSAGPIRFVVRDGERVSVVIGTVLRAYAREGRRPILGVVSNDFLMYCPGFASEVLGHGETLSSSGGRNFVLCRKQQLMFPIGVETEKSTEEAAVVIGNKGGRAVWKSLFNSLKVSSH